MGLFHPLEQESAEFAGCDMLLVPYRHGLSEKETEDSFVLYDELLGFSQPSSELDNRDPELQSFAGRALDSVNRQRSFCY